MRRRRNIRRLALAVLVVAAGSGLVAGCDTNDGRDMKEPDPYQAFQLENTNPTTTSTTTTIAPATTATTSTTSTSTSTSSTVADTADVSTVDSGSTTSAVSGLSDSGAPISSVDPAVAADTLAESLGLPDLADASVQFTGPWAPGEPIATDYSCDDDASEAPLLTWTAPPEGTAEMALIVTDESSDPVGFVHWIVVGLPPEAGSVGGPEPVVVGTEAMNSTGDFGWRPVCPPDLSAHTYRFSLYALSQPIELPASLPEDLITAIEASASGVTSFTGTYQKA